MARLFLEPTELLLVVALVLLAVQSGRRCVDRLPLLLPLSWLLGGLIGVNLPSELLQELACTVVVASAGIFVALGCGCGRGCCCPWSPHWVRCSPW